MRDKSSIGAVVRFLDYEQVLADLRQAAVRAQAQHPEIVKVLLFGSFVRGNWTADSDADLMVVVNREFERVLDRGQYAIHSPAIPIDTLVYSESEFQQLSQDPQSFVGRNLAWSLELYPEFKTKASPLLAKR